MFPGGLELSCKLDVEGVVSVDGPAIRAPVEGDVVVLGTSTNVSWNIEVFERAVIDDGDAPSTFTSATLTSNLDIQSVNVTLFDDGTALESYFDANNSGTYTWDVPVNATQGQIYRIAVWEAASGICGISSIFGISVPLSVNVTDFRGLSGTGTHAISPLRMGENASLDAGGEIYSCAGSIEVEWNHTGLLDRVDVRVCHESGAYGGLAELEDEDLAGGSAGNANPGQAVECLEPTASGILSNASYLNSTLGGDTDTCGVYGDGFYANVSWSEQRGANVYNVSNQVVVLGGVFRLPNESYTNPLSVFSAQEIWWEGLSGEGGEDATVDIILRRRGGLSSEYFVVESGNRRAPQDGKYLWETPEDSLSEEVLSSPTLETERFYLEVFDAKGGGLLCRSDDFFLVADASSQNSDTSTLLLLLTPAALLLLCCCGVFFVACPYYDKIVRRRRREMRPSLIDVDDTYIIDGEGQPAILALSAQVIPLAHAHHWPIETTNGRTGGAGGLAGVAGGGGMGSAGGGGGGTAGSGSGSNSNSYRLRRVPSSGSLGHWARAVLAMGQNVTESIGRAAGLAVGAGVHGGGGSGGSGSGGGGGGGEVEHECGVGGVGGGSGGSMEAGSSLSSWGGMRSGATWAFGGGGSIGRRSGGRRDGGGVYPTAAAALGLQLVTQQDLEEKSEAVASAGGASSTVSTASNAGGGGVRRSSSMNRLFGPRTFVGTAAIAGSAAGGSGGNVSATAGPPQGGAGGVGGGDSSNSLCFIGPSAAGGIVGRAATDADNSNGAPSSSWYSRQSSRVDVAGLLVNHGRGEGSSGGGAEGGRDGGSGSGGSGTGWLRGFGGMGGGADREKVVTVVVTEVVADRVEIVEVARAVVVDGDGFEVPTTTIVGMETIEGFSDHESYDGGGDESLGTSAVV